MSFKEVMKMPDGEERKKWMEAIKNEFENFLKRNSWIKTPRLVVEAKGRRPLRTKHVFKIKDEPT